MSLFANYDPKGRSSADRPGPSCLRMARGEDVDAISQISADREGLDADDIRHRVRGEITGEEMGRAYAVFVPVVEGQVAGFGRVRYLTHAQGGLPEVLPEGWYLTGVIVAPAFRRRGLGRLLTQARIDWVRARADEVYYVTNLRNLTSIDLHAAFGFEEISRTFAYPRVGHALGDGAAYRLQLSSSSS